MEIRTIHKINKVLHSVISPQVFVVLMFFTQLILYFDDVEGYIILMKIVSGVVLLICVVAIVITALHKGDVEAAMKDQKEKELQYWTNRLTDEGVVDDRSD